MADKSGNETVSSEQVFYNDLTYPTGTMTYSVEPTEYYIKDNTKVAKGTEGSIKTLFFKKAPTIRISAEDNPAEGSDIYSGLYKMEYTLTERDMATGSRNRRRRNRDIEIRRRRRFILQATVHRT